MGKFKQLNQNINTVIKSLKANQNICKLLTDTGYSPLNGADIENTDDIVYKNIFPYAITIKPEDSPKSYITIALDDFRRANDNTYMSNNKLIFNVLCHNDLWRVDEGLRPFFILDELDEIFCNERLIGLGKMTFESCSLIGTQNYMGYRVVYGVTGTNIKK